MTDPFWDELRRLLPDVDVVVLPPEPAAPATGESRFVAAIRARRARDDAHAVLATAWRRLLAAVPEPASARRQWLAVQADCAAVRVELLARHAGRPDLGVRDVLAMARAVVGADGGTIDERRWADADGLRLVTVLAGCGVEVYGVLTPPSITLTVVGRPVAVPAELGRELVGAGAATVPPWPATD